MRTSRSFAGRRRDRAKWSLTVAMTATLLGAAPNAVANAHTAPPYQKQHAEQGGTVVRDDLLSVFDRAGVKGTFVLLDVDRGRTTVVDRRRAEHRTIPASTFKIPHSLIALETGAVKDENEVIPYGGQPQPFPEWEKDMNLRDAVKASNVPVFQTLARRIGLKRERQWLNRLGYGNREVGTVVEHFWLRGPLEISPVEQTRWLSRLAGQKLPASKDNQRTVRDLLKIEQKDGYTLYAKTGWDMTSKPNVGWYVGWVERGGRTHTFALTIDVKADGDTGKRVPLVRDLLQRLGVLPSA